MAPENWWAAALTNVQAAKFRYGTLDLNAPSAIGIKWRRCGYIDTASVAGYASAAGKIVASVSVCQATVAVASRRESHELSHFENSPSVCSHTWKIPGVTLTIAHSQKQLRIRYSPPRHWCVFCLEMLRSGFTAEPAMQQQSDGIEPSTLMRRPRAWWLVAAAGLGFWV